MSFPLYAVRKNSPGLTSLLAEASYNGLMIGRIEGFIVGALVATVAGCLLTWWVVA